MRRATIRRATLPAALATLLLAACHDTGTGPDLLPSYDPLESLDRLNQVLGHLDAADDLLLGLALATSELYGHGTAGLFPLAVDGRGAPPLAPGARIRAAAPRAGTMLRAGEPAAITFPAELRGTTLVWSETQGYVVDESRTGAPLNGVRLIRYRMDASTGLPTSPLNAVGYTDLIGQGRSLSDRMAIVSVDQTGTTDRVVADYYVDAVSTGTAGSGTFRWSAVGSLGQGSTAIGFDVVQLFTWSQAQDLEELMTEYRYEVPGGAVHLEIEATSGWGAAAWEDVWYLARFDPGQARAAEMDVYIAPNGSLDGVFRKHGQEVILVGGTDGNPHFSRADHRSLSSAARTALNGIWDGTGDLAILTEWVVYPAYLLLAFAD